MEELGLAMEVNYIISNIVGIIIGSSIVIIIGKICWKLEYKLRNQITISLVMLLGLIVVIESIKGTLSSYIVYILGASITLVLLSIIERYLIKKIV